MIKKFFWALSLIVGLTPLGIVSAEDISNENASVGSGSNSMGEGSGFFVGLDVAVNAVILREDLSLMSSSFKSTYRGFPFGFGARA